MGFGLLLRRHPLWSVIGGFGALISVWGFVGDARDLWTAGMRPEYLQLFGFVLFAISVATVVARQQQQLDDRLTAVGNVKTLTPDKLAPPPEPAVKAAPEKRASARAPRSPQGAPAVPAKSEDREYLPVSFTKRFLTLTGSEHTEIQVNAMLRPHVGQWMRIKARLEGVSPSGNYMHVMVSASDARRILGLRFLASQEALLAAHKPGESITFDARVEQIGGTLKLVDGQLL